MSKIKEILNQTGDKVKESFFSVKVGYDYMKDFFEEGSEGMLHSLKKLSDISLLSKDSLADFTNKIIELSPVLESAGFSIRGINIGVTLPPKISISLQKNTTVDEEQMHRILETHADNETLILILKSINSISQFQEKLTLANFELDGIDIDISIPPGVNLKLKKKVE